MQKCDESFQRTEIFLEECDESSGKNTSLTNNVKQIFLFRIRKFNSEEILLQKSDE